jgi:hypothetical protein
MLPPSLAGVLMTSSLAKFSALLLTTVVLLQGCANRSAQPVEPVVIRPVPQKIALVAVQDPPMLNVENRGSALGFFAFAGHMVQKDLDRSRSIQLTSMMRGHALHLGDEMTAALQAELVRRGYTVQVLKNVKRLKDDPDAIDYDSIEADADAIVSARYFGAGLFAGYLSTSYLPRLNVDIEVVAKSDQSELHSHSIYYGVDARRPEPDQIPSDAKYTYGSFEQAIERQREVLKSYRVGVRQIAALAATQLHQVGR